MTLDSAVSPPALQCVCSSGQSTSLVLASATAECSRTDDRGMHWKEKVSNGQGPKPWIYTQFWADKRSQKESEFEALMLSKGSDYKLPWRRQNAVHRAIGNTNKVLQLFVVFVSL